MTGRAHQHPRDGGGVLDEKLPCRFDPVITNNCHDHWAAGDKGPCPQPHTPTAPDTRAQQNGPETERKRSSRILVAARERLQKADALLS